jgi:hypothetical protein
MGVQQVGRRGGLIALHQAWGCALYPKVSPKRAERG